MKIDRPDGADNKNDFKTPATGFGTLRLQNQDLRIGHKPSGIRGFLNVIRSQADLGMHVFVDGPILLGRDPKCNLALHDFGVSRRHALIRPLPNGEYVLEDLNSTNGTRVNGDLVPGSKVLKNGEKILLGDTVVRFSLADEMEIDFHSEVATLVGTDPLTGLPAKQRFDQAFEFAVTSSQLTKSPLALMMMDMDGVKQINDQHGHLFGAYVIGETGKLIHNIVRNNGEACRFGGDEFSAFLPEHDSSSAFNIGEKIRTAVEQAGLEKDGILLKPTISIGIACCPEAGTQTLELITAADKALYDAKGQGKNRTVCFVPGVGPEGRSTRRKLPETS